MKKQLAILGIVALISTTACNNQPEKEKTATSSDTLSQPMYKTLAMVQGSCFSCHSPERESVMRIAPGLADVRQAYMTDSITEEEFVNNIINFVDRPGNDNSRMPEAVRQYGMMPMISYKEEDLRKMAAYIYHNDMSTDEWYDQWKNHKDDAAEVATEDMSYEDLGQSIANGTKTQLGKNLMAAIKQHGAPGAVTFCNTRAIALTDSMSQVYHANVKRVSDQPRNPDNRANDAERAYINQLKEQIAKGEKLSPQVTEINGKMVGYYAIATNKMCLQCHGDKDKDILPETWANIHKAYPDDKATGYGENQIRGIWVVTMDKK